MMGTENLIISLLSSSTVHGELSEWSPWGNCTTLCGGGVRYRSRECDNPSPSNGGNSCVGEMQRSESCNINRCPSKFHISNK